MTRVGLVALLLLALAPPASAQAQTVVDRCRWDTEPGGRNLAQALAIGGRVTFACPPGTSIRMTTGHTVAAGTVIDGDGRVALDAHGARMTMLRVPSGRFEAARLEIRNAVLPQGPPAFPARASVLFASEDVSLTDVTISGSERPVLIRGDARVSGSAFLNNASWAMSIDGQANVSGTRFLGNGTGLSVKRGIVRDSVFSQNTTAGLRVTYPNGEVNIIRSVFRRNVGEGAVLLSQRSNADPIPTVRLRGNTFDRNIGTDGGAVTIYDSTVGAPASVIGVLLRFPPARFELAFNSFTENSGGRAGAISADLHNTVGLSITGGLFVGNRSSTVGGAVSWVGRSVLIANSLFRANEAGRGGALYADYPEAGARWVVVNSLLVGNRSAGGGGTIEVGPVEVVNSTIADNEGTGFAADVHGSPPDRPRVANSIISGNSEGNCRGIAASSFRGVNLQFGHRDCEGVPVADPQLDAMYVPAPGNAALVSGEVSVCRAEPVSRRDLAFQSRATEARCALGAFERPPLRRVPQGER